MTCNKFDIICDYFSENMMKKVHNKARIHGSLIMMGLTIVGYIGIAFKSRKAAQRGESIEKINEKWLRESKDRIKLAFDDAKKNETTNTKIIIFLLNFHLLLYNYLIHYLLSPSF